MIVRFAIFIFLISLLATSCATYQNSSGSRNLNVSFIYNPGSTTIHPQYVVFNETDTSSKIYFSIKSNELMFASNGEISQANIRVKYMLYKSAKTLTLCDSATIFYHINNPNYITDIIKSFEVKVKDTASYFLDLTVYDVNQDRGNQKFLSIERNKRINRNDALITNLNDIPYFSSLLSDTDTFKVVLRKGITEKWQISYYQNKFSLRPAPYSIGNYKFTPPKADSTVTAWIKDTSKFVLKNEGIMHFYQDTLDLGFSVIRLFPSFPDVTTPGQLLQPLRMLTTQKEFNDMNMLANKKESADKFWLTAGGNINRARELIRVFYTRVMLSNLYFSSYTDGWKTDRGLIYIIFGLPVTIYKAENIERWIYGTTQSNKTLVFNFTRNDNPFSNNDFILSRDEMYKISWTQAVDTWRNGRVYSVAY